MPESFESLRRSFAEAIEIQADIHSVMLQVNEHVHVAYQGVSKIADIWSGSSLAEPELAEVPGLATAAKDNMDFAYQWSHNTVASAERSATIIGTIVGDSINPHAQQAKQLAAAQPNLVTETSHAADTAMKDFDEMSPETATSDRLATVGGYLVQCSERAGDVVTNSNTIKQEVNAYLDDHGVAPIE